MIYLSGVHRASLLTVPSVGLMAQPENSMRAHLRKYGWWAADNGCFAKGDAFDAEAWITWLGGLPDRDRCLFAVAPDVVGNAAATLERSAPWLPRIRALGYPVALAAQDGLAPAMVPWDDIDCLFIGGTTTWKLSYAVTTLVREAKRRGKWVHMGRVNSLPRIQAAVLMGCDSADGTYIAFRARGGGGDRGVWEIGEWLDILDRHPFLPIEARVA